jgi:hypothetical protein
MAMSLFKRGRGPARFIALFSGVGLLLPLVATAFVYSIFTTLDRLPSGWGRDTVLLSTPIAFASIFLWPPALDAYLYKIGGNADGMFNLLAQGALMNGTAFAVLGALLWYALYRRSWAWYALAGVAAAHWETSLVRLGVMLLSFARRAVFGSSW